MDELDVIREIVVETLEELGYDVDEETFIGTYYYNDRDTVVITISPRITLDVDPEYTTDEEVIEEFREELEKKVRKLGFKVKRITELETQTTVVLERTK